MIASKSLSPVELAQLYFDRIDRLDSKLNSYLTLNYDEAMAQARAAEEAVTRGDELGPLQGLGRLDQGPGDHQGTAHHRRISAVQGPRA